jgi:integrase
MASITQRNGSFRVRIHRKDKKPISKSFKTHSEALDLVKKTEAQLQLGIYEEPCTKAHIDPKMSFSTAVEKYLKSHSIHKASHRDEVYILQNLCKRWPTKGLGDIQKQDVACLKDDLIANSRAASTINHYLNALSQLYQAAINEWGLKASNPIEGIKRIREPSGRMKRLPQEAEQILLKECQRKGMIQLKHLITLAIETGMRQGEILSMHWEDIDLKNRRIVLRHTKNGDSRQVPLTTRAKETLEQLVCEDNKELPFTQCHWVLRKQFSRLIKNLANSDKCNYFNGLRFHDLRHEALSRLSDKGLNVIELAHISGHRTLAMLRRYTHPCHRSLIDKLDKIN